MTLFFKFIDNNTSKMKAKDLGFILLFTNLILLSKFSNAQSPLIIDGVQVNKPAFTYTNGAFELQWTADTNTVDFTFSTTVTASDNIWAAFAFSTDKGMVI